MRSRQSRRVVVLVAVFACAFLWLCLQSPSRLPMPELLAKQNETTSIDSNVTEHIEELPLLFGIGMGATGTHTLFQALCLLGIPSVHFREICVRPSNETSTAEASLIAADILLGLKGHLQVLQSFRGLKKCAVQARAKLSPADSEASKTRLSQGDGTCYSNEMNRWKFQLLEAVENVVTSGLGSIHDVPYPQLWPWVIRNFSPSTVSDRLTHSASNSREVRLLMTLRNATEWAKRRSDKHGYTADVACWNQTDRAIQRIGRGVNDWWEMAWDLPACLEATQGDPTKSMWGYKLLPRKEPESGVLNTLTDDKDSIESHFLEFFAEAMEKYQQNALQHEFLLFSINLWEGQWDSNSLALHIQTILLKKRMGWRFRNWQGKWAILGQTSTAPLMIETLKTSF